MTLIKADLLSLKSFFIEKLYSLSQNIDRIRTEFDQPIFLEENKNFLYGISSKDLTENYKLKIF